MSEHNPIYQTFLRSGFMGQLEDRFRRAGEHSAIFKAVSSERRAVMSMWKRGVISYDEYVSLTAKISRALHARILRDAMRGVSLAGRQRTISQFRKIAPAGMSSYNCRMGYGLKAARLGHA